MYMANLVLCLSTVPFIAERDKELIKKKPRRINKSEKSADATLHKELHGLFLDLCVEDKEIHTSPCLYLSFQPLQKRQDGRERISVITLTLFYGNTFSFLTIDLKLLISLTLVKTPCTHPKLGNRNQ